MKTRSNTPTSAAVGIDGFCDVEFDADTPARCWVKIGRGGQVACQSFDGDGLVEPTEQQVAAAVSEAADVFAARA